MLVLIFYSKSWGFKCLLIKKNKTFHNKIILLLVSTIVNTLCVIFFQVVTQSTRHGARRYFQRRNKQIIIQNFQQTETTAFNRDGCERLPSGLVEHTVIHSKKLLSNFRLQHGKLFYKYSLFIICSYICFS